MHTSGTHLYTLWQKQRKIRIKLAFVLVASVLIFLWLRPHIFQQQSATQSGNTSEAVQLPDGITKESPNFAALSPSGKKVEWSRLSPPGSASFYVYTDTLEGVPIRISEQALPNNLKSDETVAELAKNYNANRSIAVDEVTVYIGTSAKQTQSIIFVKRSLLILITSNNILNDHQWSEYISSLQ